DDDKYKIGVARALRDDRQPDRPILAVILAEVATDATMGVPQDQLHDESRKAVLVGPEDQREPGDEDLVPLSDKFPDPPKRYLILLHPGYGHGDEPIEFPKDRSRFLSQQRQQVKQLSLPDEISRDSRQGTDAHYRDPVAERLPEYAGRWLAGFAPVGNTEY